MKTQIISIDNYKVETYFIEDQLSITVAYNNTKKSLPANGGLRFCKYESLFEVQDEALTLARKMTQKHELYNTGFSGVKLVASGDVTDQSKLKVLHAAAEILNNFNGKIYTGCDLNISNEDMDYLFSLTPYVLNGIGSSVNTSTATAYGVYGSLMAAMAFEDHLDIPKRFVIHGLGKIGTVIAEKLIQLGHLVYTYDVNIDAANITGSINISHRPDWHQTPCDYMVLCSKSGVIDEYNVSELNTRWIVSSANAPFSNDSVTKILKLKNINWLPDVVSNAGAVICDSLEFIDPKKYQQSNPEMVYKFVYDAKWNKTQKILSFTKTHHISPDEAVKLFFVLSENENILDAKLA